LKQKNIDKKLFVVFQPHQFNRTLNLIEWFKNCFSSADTLIIPDIYESRDSFEDKEKINSEKLIDLINLPNKIDWNWMWNTLKSILDYDTKNPNSSIILLLWAWNVDDLRYKIKVI
jgi:UDP-N-acetylmuramate--alanine ligase